jgi:hypothetical protein
VLKLLAKIMTELFGDHPVHSVLNGPFLDVHVASIFQLLKRKLQSSLTWGWEV